jgi:hypothetical protein
VKLYLHSLNTSSWHSVYVRTGTLPARPVLLPGVQADIALLSVAHCLLDEGDNAFEGC